MRRVCVVVCALAWLLTLVGCSGKLSRRQAKNLIEDARKPHPVGPNKVMVPGAVPGFAATEDDTIDPPYINLGDHMTYGALSFEKDEPPSSDDYLMAALAKLGYLTVQEEGPRSTLSGGMTLNYSHSRTVHMGPRAGFVSNSSSTRDYSAGFHCYPPPGFDQCNLPPFIQEDGTDFTVTGIVQDDTHAQVNILIPWKLSSVALELKPYAAEDLAELTKSPDSDYYRYPALFRWIQFLTSHNASGQSPATILFQKFDDGWRIVDSTGKSSKDFGPQK